MINYVHAYIIGHYNPSGSIMYVLQNHKLGFELQCILFSTYIPEISNEYSWNHLYSFSMFEVLIAFILNYMYDVVVDFDFL